MAKRTCNDLAAGCALSSSERTARATFLLVTLVLLFAPSHARAATEDTIYKDVPGDTCILELNLPDDARVTIDGHDYGAGRRLEFRKLVSGKRYTSIVQVDFQSGETEEFRVFIEGGRVVRLAASGSSKRRPGLVLQHGHAGGMLCGALSRDGRQLITGGLDHTAILWDVPSRTKLRVYQGHLGPIIDVQISNDGTRLLTTGLDESAILWDTVTGERVRTFACTSGGIPCAALSSNGRYVLTDTPDATATLWSVDTGKAVRTYRGHSSPLSCVAISPDGERVLTGSFDQTAILWNRTTGRKIHTFGGHKYGVNSVVFSGDARQVLTVDGLLNVAALWDVASGKRLQTYRGDWGAHENGTDSVAFCPDGRTMLMNCQRSAILWDLASGKRLHTFKIPMWDFSAPKLLSIAFAPDGRPLAIGLRVFESLNVSIWDVNTEREEGTFLTATSPILCVANSPGNDRLFAAAFGLGARTSIWDMNLGRQERSVCDPGQSSGAVGLSFKMFAQELGAEVKGHTNVVTCAAFSSDGQRLVTGSVDTTAIIWDMVSGNQIHRLTGHRGFLSFVIQGIGRSAGEWWKLSQNGEMPQPDPNEIEQWLAKKPGCIESVAYSPDGQRILTGGEDNVAILWDASSGRKLNTFEGHSNAVTSVAFSRDGTRALTGSLDGTVIVWDVSTAKRIRTFSAPPTSLDMAHYPHTQVIVQHDPREAARVGEAAMAMVLSHRTSVHTVDYEPHGDRILATFGDGTAAVWDSRTGRKLQVLQSDTSSGPLCTQFHPGVFSPDGRKLATGTDEGLVLVWDADSGKELRRFYGHHTGVTSLLFDERSEKLASGSRDGTVRLWDIGSGQELARLITLNETKDWAVVTPEGLFDGSAAARERVMFRIGDGLKVVPVDRFFQDFYYPGLLAAIWRGERPLPKVQIGQSLPPRLRIVSPTGGEVDKSHVIIEAEATDEGGGIRGPWLVQNGARVLAPGDTERKDKIVRRTFELDLVQGENRVEVHAASADGSWESEPAGITLRYEKPLPKSDLYLVAVGINDYGEQSLNMQFAVPDAMSMARLFKDRGRELYADVHITTLTDENAMSSAILQAIRDAGHQARPQDTVAVFLAGHGTVVDRQYYFIPGDFRRKSDTLDEDLRTQSLLASDINDVLGSTRAVRRLLVFDTGQSGGRFGLTRTARSPFAFRGAVERLARAQGTFAIAAAAVSDDAGEVPQLKHGVLTYSLLAGLRAVDEGPLANQWIEPVGGDRVADVLEWFGFASARVAQLTKQYFQQQQDVQHASSGMSFPVLPIPESDRQPATATDLASNAPTARPPEPKPRPRPQSIREPKGTSDLYLLSVGINRYAQEAMNLKFAAPDAKAITRLFAERGSSVYRRGYAKQLLDEHATRSAILGALKTLAGQVQSDDTFVVYLSGHGTMVGQRYYFIPHDFHGEANSLEDDIRALAIPADILGDAISEIPAKKRILIFDTCASGGALEVNRQGRDPFAFRGAIEKLGQQEGVFTLAACSAGAEAQEIEELGHGVLTYALLAGLKAVRSGPLEGLSVQPASPDGMADVLEWFSYASGHVPRLTKRYLGREQEVQVAGQGVSFPILPAAE